MKSPHDPDQDLETRLRDAFRAAAGDVHPRANRAAVTSNPRVTTRASTRRRTIQRWLVPGLAAAAVAAIALPVALGAGLFGPAHTGSDTHGSVAAASARTTEVTQSDGWATVAGVRFPVPQGWDVVVAAQSGRAIAVCVAETSSAPSCEGVTVTVAVPDADGSIAPVPDPVSSDPLIGVSSASAESGAPTTLTTSAGSDPAMNPPARKDRTSPCPRIVDTDAIGGRAAIHYAIGPCTAGSAQSNAYYVTDGSVAISTPRGQATAQADQIAAGIDFSRYAHDFGPQVAYLSGSDAATGSAPASVAPASTASAFSVATATSVESPGATAATAGSTAADPGSPGQVENTSAAGSLVSTDHTAATDSTESPSTQATR